MDAAVVAIAGDGDADAGHRCCPLLSSADDDEIRPYPASSPSPQHPAGAERKPRRVASLDVFRGLTVAVSLLPRPDFSRLRGRGSSHSRGDWGFGFFGLGRRWWYWWTTPAGRGRGCTTRRGSGWRWPTSSCPPSSSSSASPPPSSSRYTPPTLVPSPAYLTPKPEFCYFKKKLWYVVLHPFQIISRLDFATGLIKFVEKSNNIFNPKQIYYKNIFNYWFNETNLVL